MKKEFLNHIFESYLLNIPNFKPGDKVLDCGANVGELFLAFENLNLDIDYLGFEPDPNVFECLNLNTDKSNYNCALSNRKEEVDFYIDSSGGNSSIHESKETKLKQKVEARLLDEFIKNEKIKLLKLDAEGYELEVLLGGEDNLHNISYISVDCGAEKGISQETTFVEVNNYLTSKNFEIIAINEKRLICLYKIKMIDYNNLSENIENYISNLRKQNSLFQPVINGATKEGQLIEMGHTCYALKVLYTINSDILNDDGFTSEIYRRFESLKMIIAIYLKGLT